MKRLTIMFALVAAVCSCQCYKNCPYKSIETKDSTYVKEVTIYHDSTLYYTVTDSIVTIATKDTSSRLETDYATSEASVSGGILHHTLRNKSGLRPISVSIPETTITENSTQTITRTIEIEQPLTKWQKIQIFLGDLMLGAIGALILISVIRLILKR